MTRQAANRRTTLRYDQATVTLVGTFAGCVVSWTCPHCRTKNHSTLTRPRWARSTRCGKCRRGVDLLGMQEAWAKSEKLTPRVDFAPRARSAHVPSLSSKTRRRG